MLNYLKKHLNKLRNSEPNTAEMACNAEVPISQCCYVPASLKLAKHLLQLPEKKHHLGASGFYLGLQKTVYHVCMIVYIAALLFYIQIVSIISQVYLQGFS